MYTSIPNLHVSSKAKVVGDGSVYIHSRDDAATAGIFKIRIDVVYNPPIYPALNTLEISTSLSDGTNGVFKATTVETINSYGKHNPTVYLTGRCMLDGNDIKGFKYWVMIANNKASAAHTSPDIVGFCIIDGDGNRVNYGTGPLRTGDITVSPL